MVAWAKARSKNIKKHTKESQAPGEHLFLNATGPFPQTIGGSKYNAKIIDQFSCKAWMAHIKAKTQIANPVKQHMDTLKEQGKTIQYLCCNNAPKDGSKLATICKEHSITIEFTVPYPQQNGVVKRKMTVHWQCSSAH